MSKLKYLVIHCTATPEGRAVTAKDIREWHMSPVEKGGRGWKQVGYSDMIHLNGAIENLVPYNNDDVVDAWEISNGVAGINAQARHVVYVGGCTKFATTHKDTRTNEQRLALANYVRQTIAQHPDILIAGHNQFDAKACPSFDVRAMCKAHNIPENNIYQAHLKFKLA